VTALTALQLACDDLAVVSAARPTLRQRRQLALRAFINNSQLEGGDARELNIKDCAFASGVISAVPQAFATVPGGPPRVRLPSGLHSAATEAQKGYASPVSAILSTNGEIGGKATVASHGPQVTAARRAARSKDSPYWKPAG
jgi:hypothetical protein